MANQPSDRTIDANKSDPPPPPPPDYWGGPVDDRITKPVIIKDSRYVESLLEATKDINNSFNEITKEFSHYAKIVADIQERSFKTSKLITDSYIETQKEIMRIYQPLLDRIIHSTDRFYENFEWWDPYKDRQGHKNKSSK